MWLYAHRDHAVWEYLTKKEKTVYNDNNNDNDYYYLMSQY